MLRWVEMPDQRIVTGGPAPLGSGLCPHGRAAAAGLERGTGSFQGDERGRFAVTAQPVVFPAATGESEKRTHSETLDAGAPPPATSTTTSAAEDVETLDQGSPPVTSSDLPLPK